MNTLLPLKNHLKKIIAKRPDVVFALIEKLLLLSKEPAISIEYDLRVTLEIESDLMRLLDIGRHDEVY